MNIPKYINEKRNIIKLVALTAVFALVFINIYKPFGSKNWYPNVSEFMYLVYTSLIILTGVLVVIISRLIMYFYSRKHEISYINYVVWVLTEILSMSLFYTIYSISVKLKGGASVDVMAVFKNATINTALVLLLPYASLWFYFGWQESTKRLQKIESGDEPELNPLKSITFKDEKGALMLSILLEDLLYIESADNYVVIHYVTNGKSKTYLLRNSLKNLESLLRRTPVARCHRSFLVNFNRVKVIRRSKEGLMLEIDVADSPDIPVSKSFQGVVSSKFLCES
ncbi:MAG: LytTR family transcriptional regulator [Bacteroidetes bacterium GWF2_40_14]|nr:MAG: LytTR family transcriptional regulator [Bacteroidetes bacterium GWF2_40_14]